MAKPANTIKKIKPTPTGDTYDICPTMMTDATGTYKAELPTLTKDETIATQKYVDDSISGLPTPMQFKGSVGSGGTIEWSALPTASSSNGYVYKVITKHTTTPICEVGDTIVSNGTNWVVIPSGDEPSGTVTNVAGAVASGSHLTVSGSPITSSGTLTYGVESGYSIPSDTKQAEWDVKPQVINLL